MGPSTALGQSFSDWKAGQSVFLVPPVRSAIVSTLGSIPSRILGMGSTFRSRPYLTQDRQRHTSMREANILNRMTEFGRPESYSIGK